MGRGKLKLAGSSGNEYLRRPRRSRCPGAACHEVKLTVTISLRLSASSGYQHADRGLSCQCTGTASVHDSKNNICTWKVSSGYCFVLSLANRKQKQRHVECLRPQYCFARGNLPCHQSLIRRDSSRLVSLRMVSANKFDLVPPGTRVPTLSCQW